MGSAESQKIGSSRRWAEVCERLAATASKLEKRALIAEYLRLLDLEDAARAALYLGGLPFSQTDPRTLNIGGALLGRVIAELTGADAPSMHAAYRRHGDLGAAAYDLLSAAGMGQGTLPELTLFDLEESFSSIAAVSKPQAKQRLTRALLERSTPLEAKYWIKLALGDMRTGVKESLIEEAVAAAYDESLAGVRRAITLTGNLAEVVGLAGSHRLQEAKMRLFHPLGFMLASPVATVDEAVERFSPASTAAEAPIPAVQISAQVPAAQMEDKYDGVRAQIHCGDPEQPGRVAIFSRSKEDITESFPELVEAFAAFSTPTILDGEILAWSSPASSVQVPNSPKQSAADEDLAIAEAAIPNSPDAEQTEERKESVETGSGFGRALPFTFLQPRLGRKRITAEMRANTPVVFMAFDLLYSESGLLLERALWERRRILEELVRREQPRTVLSGAPLSISTIGQGHFNFCDSIDQSQSESLPRLLLAPAVRLAGADQLEQAYVDARLRGNEGVMLKGLESAYLPGRRGFFWLKLKRELATLDVVVTAAEYGHGRRAGTLSDYTFSIRAGDELKAVGKAYSGLTDAEIAALTEFFMAHTLEDYGSVRTVEPLLVLEVAFNNVMRSDRHDSGFALRFPRIVRIRTDKPVSEIDTLERVEEIYRSQ